MTESKNDPTRRRLDQITATRTDSPEGMVIARQLLSAVQAALDLHARLDMTGLQRVGDGKTYDAVCEHCTDTYDPFDHLSDDWPCPTVKAIAGALEVEL